MIDHIGFRVANLQPSKQFYLKALAPLDYSVFMELNNEHESCVELGIKDMPYFWIGQAKEGKPVNPPMHIAFRAANKSQVDKFYEAAIGAGATCNGKPGPRPQYHAHYYAAFVIDPNGHNLEAAIQDYKE